MKLNRYTDTVIFDAKKIISTDVNSQIITQKGPEIP